MHTAESNTHGDFKNEKSKYFLNKNGNWAIIQLPHNGLQYLEYDFAHISHLNEFSCSPVNLDTFETSVENLDYSTQAITCLRRWQLSSPVISRHFKLVSSNLSTCPPPEFCSTALNNLRLLVVVSNRQVAHSHFDILWYTVMRSFGNTPDILQINIIVQALM